MLPGVMLPVDACSLKHTVANLKRSFAVTRVHDSGSRMQMPPVYMAWVTNIDTNCTVQLQITYGFKPAAAPAPPSPAAEKDVPYGFVPRDFVLKEPSASAFWPEVKICACLTWALCAPFLPAVVITVHM